MARTKGKARKGAAGHTFREASKLKALSDKAGQVQASSLKRKAEDDQPEVVKEPRLDNVETDSGIKEAESREPARTVAKANTVGPNISTDVKNKSSEDLAPEAVAKAEAAPVEKADVASGSPAKLKSGSNKAAKASNGSVRHKRAVQRPPTLATDIYVSRKSTVQAQAKRARTLLDGPDFTFLTIHGLGAAINRAIELALHLKEQYQDQIAWTISLSTVTLVDDVEPEELDDDVSTETRQNSAVHIRIVKVNGTPAHAE
ncbi:ribonucleases P/MRP protein subunit pop7 [Geranomyces variabilis]|uniref:Ribonucleases P/MRP protein subunit pop7 n=1 Tax=Geranomyces variabilis TaxID=109894 RepID=A0AAD5TH21_9FUNG|nr:ribonucleases P/MRP protein subunit pop7 [Geranomyces variabilis]